MINATKKILLFLSVILICGQINGMDLFLCLPGNNTVISTSKAKWMSVVAFPVLGVVGAMLHDRHVPTKQELGEVAIIGGVAGLATAYCLYNLTPRRQSARGSCAVGKIRNNPIVKKQKNIEQKFAQCIQNKEALNDFFLTFCKQNSYASPRILYKEASDLYLRSSYEEARLKEVTEHNIYIDQQLLPEVTNIKNFMNKFALHLENSECYQNKLRSIKVELKESKFNWKTKVSYLAKILSVPLIAAFIIALAHTCGLKIQLPSQIPPINIILPGGLFEH